MKETTPKNIILQKDGDGYYWLITPNALICLNHIKGPVAKKAWLEWAKKELGE